MSENNSNSLFALLAGVAIGAGLGLLFAPDNGRKTRQKLKEGVDEIGDELQQQLAGLNRKIRDTVADKNLQLQESVDGLMSEAGEGTEALIENLEARLQQLKSRVRRDRDPS